MQQHDRFAVRHRRLSTVAITLDWTQSAAGLLLFLVVAARLVGITSAVEPDRPSSSANRASKGAIAGIGTATPRHVARQEDRPEVRAQPSVSVDDDLNGTTSSPGRYTTTELNQRHNLWAETAYSYIQRVDCSGVRGGSSGGRPSFASTARECLDVQRLPRGQLNVYVAGPSPRGGRLKTVLPDGPIESVSAPEVASGAHDGVVAIDPYPDANFGHLVIVFHVTFGVTDTWCRRREGLHMGRY